MSQAFFQSSSLNQVLITEVLFRRVPRPVNLEAENYALHKLAQQMAETPETLLQNLVAIAVELCQAGSAGISIPEITTDGEEIFRWVALAGAYANATNTPPRYFSLCGTCLDKKTPQLFTHPELYFTYFKQLRPMIVECLVIPLLVGKQALGTIWIASHNQTRQFDLEDLRVMSSLANFTAAALNHSQARYAAEAAVAHEQAALRELERANLAKDDFLAAVSHELRTPLTNIRMAIQMLSLATEPERRQQYLRILQTECDREIALVNDLLELQRLEAEVDSDEWSPVLLQEWLLPIVEPFVERAQVSQQFLWLDLPSDLPVLMVDPAKLQGIVTELLNNACKYTPVSGEITLAVSSTPNSISLSISNTGIEIPADALPRIFEKFYRVPSTITAERTGTGLGLALVQKLVAVLGGKVRVVSQNNSTTFTIELPRIKDRQFPTGLSLVTVLDSNAP